MCGKKLMEEVFNSGDKFWTFVYGQAYEHGYYGFEKNHTKAQQFYILSKTQPLSDCSLFRPLYFSYLELKLKFL
jgi:hypothetical protein